MGGGMERIGEVLEALKRVEIERLSAMAYASWVPLVALGSFLSALTGNPAFSQGLWGLGLIPFVWTVRRLNRLGRETRKWNGKLTVALASALGTSLALAKIPLLSLTIATIAIIIAVTLARPRVSWIELVTVALIALLTSLGSQRLGAWEAFSSAFVIGLSFATLAHLAYGVYEVVPYVERD
ncbi:hypothetical protein IPA_07640 [Ignicoccus pacificus DSM 13166]|uniref:Uncharacterized protein n=1 Tax=Ignicoccus pacificus DSM 13166 TaxID=940294 RepID=A0A977KBP7_9CREN|nr:hypothetical protein IPA_07640 [Ignicoccus pacificus DSM 13166]